MLGLTHLVQFLADFDRGEYEKGELLAYGLVPAVIAALVFWIGIKLQFAGKPKWIKWLAILPLVAGFVISIEPVRMFYFDNVYKMYGGNWKTGVMHAFGMIMAVISGIGLFLWSRLLQRQKYDEL